MNATAAGFNEVGIFATRYIFPYPTRALSFITTGRGKDAAAIGFDQALITAS